MKKKHFWTVQKKTLRDFSMGAGPKQKIRTKFFCLDVQNPKNISAHSVVANQG